MQAGPAVQIAQAEGAVRAEQAVRARLQGAPNVGWEEKGELVCFAQRSSCPQPSSQKPPDGSPAGQLLTARPLEKALTRWPHSQAFRIEGSGKRSPFPYLVTPSGQGHHTTRSHCELPHVPQALL